MANDEQISLRLPTSLLTAIDETAADLTAAHGLRVSRAAVIRMFLENVYRERARELAAR